MNAPLVSFVVPTYNAAPFVGDCVRSILAQTARVDFEIIVVNDASPDDTDAVMQAFDDLSFTEPATLRSQQWFGTGSLTYIRHAQNQGHVVTINEGFARARGKFIARIDSDDRYRPHFLERALPVLEKFPQVGMVYGDVAMIDPRGEILKASSDTVHGGHDFCGDEYLALLEENFVSAPTVLARREAWADALPIPPGLGFSDWYLSLRIARKHNLYFIADVLADYRLHGNNLHRAMARDRSEEQTILRLLDAAFAEPDHAAEKRARRARIYGTHYARLGDKYFGHAMHADARRCYLEALRQSPRVLNGAQLRRLAATLNPVAYQQLKTALGKWKTA